MYTPVATGRPEASGVDGTDLTYMIAAPLNDFSPSENELFLADRCGIISAIPRVLEICPHGCSTVTPPASAVLVPASETLTCEGRAVTLASPRFSGLIHLLNLSRLVPRGLKGVLGIRFTGERTAHIDPTAARLPAFPSFIGLVASARGLMSTKTVRPIVGGAG
jgi:hypothetical protein